MSTATLDRPAAGLRFDEIQSFLHAEARALDDRDWDTWLTFYHRDCPFRMPAWDDFDTLTEDPQNEMSLMYCPNRQGIEDRVFRIKTDRSSATSLPEPRTNHNIANIEVLSRDGGQIRVRFNWHTLSSRCGKASGADAVFVFYAGGEAISCVKQYESFGLKAELPLYGAPQLSSVLIYALLAAVLVIKPVGLFPAKG